MAQPKVFFSYTIVAVPVKSLFNPIIEPLSFGGWIHKKFHLHHLKFPSSKNEITGGYFVPEGFAYLGYSKGQLASSCRKDVWEVDEDTLSSLWAEIYVMG